MKKFKSVCILTICFLAILSLVQISEAANVRVRVITGKANIHLKPSIESMVIASVPLGAVLDSDAQIGEWYRVNLPPGEDGVVITGYLHSSVLQTISGKPAMETVPQAPPPPARPARAYTPATGGAKAVKGIKIMGGLSLASIALADEDDWVGDFKTRTGLVFGAGYEFRPLRSAPAFALEVNALYLTKGFKYHEKYTFLGITSIADMKVTTGELSIPVLAKYYLNKGNAPYLCAGFEVGLVLSNKARIEIDYSGGGVSGSETETEDLKEDTKSLDLGLVFGGGYEHLIKGTVVVMDVRYHLGLTNLVKDADDPDAMSDWIKSRAIVVMLGVKF